MVSVTAGKSDVDYLNERPIHISGSGSVLSSVTADDSWKISIDEMRSHEAFFKDKVKKENDAFEKDKIINRLKAEVRDLEMQLACFCKGQISCSWCNRGKLCRAKIQQNSSEWESAKHMATNCLTRHQSDHPQPNPFQ